jgi:hypothetical protein
MFADEPFSGVRRHHETLYVLYGALLTSCI